MKNKQKENELTKKDLSMIAEAIETYGQNMDTDSEVWYALFEKVCRLEKSKL